MMKRKLELKKQVIASLSDLEKKNILGGANARLSMPETGCTVPSIDPDAGCQPSWDNGCATDICTLGC